MKTWQNDWEFEDVFIKNVTLHDNGCEVQREDGWFFGLGQVDPIPEPGDMLRIWGGGIGRPIRGVAVWRDSWIIYHYKTNEQMIEDHQLQMEEKDDKARQKFLEHIDERNAAVDNLPEIFQHRINHFQTIAGPEFRWKDEFYEVFVCQQAALIAETLPSVADIHTFSQLSFSNQQEVIPELSENHSGNTFGASCWLAQAYVEGRDDLIVTDYGALSPLVGSYKDE